jgi:arylsulfatase A-like enzyme
MKAILVLMDSLNRNYLEAYNGNTWVKTPNLTRFSRQSNVFDGHYICSAPCMPARRDLLTGRPNFLERSWGPVEAYDITMTQCMREAGIYSHIVTDHCHYMDRGGENYLQEYNTWDYQRGQEYDPWISKVTPPAPCKHYGVVFPQYELNRTAFRKEEDYPTPKTFEAACKWLEKNKDEDNFFLQVEVFDPHEPFDTPQSYLDMYHDTYTGIRFDCSTYEKVTEPPEAIAHLQKKYGACMTMTDHWFGTFISKLQELGLYDDTLIIVTSDHGHLLGEHGFTGKNYMHGYNQLSNIPMMIRLPGTACNGKRFSNLSQAIDIPATFLDYFNVAKPSTMLGSSLLPLLRGETDTTKDAIIYGWFGGPVNVTDGHYTYFRAAEREDNRPLFNYCSTPTTLLHFMGNNCQDEIEMGHFLGYSDFPVYKIPAYFPLGHFKSNKYVRDSLLFDIINDYGQTQPLHDPAIEKDMTSKLLKLMAWADAPSEQYVRLGLPCPRCGCPE